MTRNEWLRIYRRPGMAGVAAREFLRVLGSERKPRHSIHARIERRANGRAVAARTVSTFDCRESR